MTRIPIISTLALATLIGCGDSGPGASTTCGEAECAAICAPKIEAAKAGSEAPAPASPEKSPKGLALSDFEEGILKDVVADLRAGVRPFDDKGIGLCKGQGKTCDEYLGLKAGVLPPGEYMVRAELLVPKTGEKGTWSIQFSTDCTTSITNAAGDTTERKSSRSRSYEVAYAGASRGYRLSPLYTIKSPNPEGEERCTYSIVAPHPDGDKVYEGEWTLPKK